MRLFRVFPRLTSRGNFMYASAEESVTCTTNDSMDKVVESRLVLLLFALMKMQAYESETWQNVVFPTGNTM